MRPSRRAAFYLLASLVVTFLAGSSAPTPLYAMYQAAWGFSPVTVTVVFGIYAIAVLAALLVVGSLSDYVGRRPVLIVGAVIQAIAMVMFATAGGLPALIAARVVQGLATGLAAGAVGAAMLDLDRERGTIANAISPMLGTGTGALISGLMVEFLPAPTHLVYAILAAVFVAQAIGVAFMAETASPKPGALQSLRPRFQLPAAVRHPMLLAVPALVAAWALVGFYGSLGPALVRALVGAPSRALGGIALSVMAVGGVAAVLAFHARPGKALMALGTSTLASGVALTLLAVHAASLAGFLGASALAGAGFGLTFQGAIRTVIGAARAHERAGVLSLLYVVSYLAMGVPAVLGGLRVVHGGGVLDTASEYGIAVIALASLALFGTLGRRATAATAA
jgi:MFS family permease